MILLFLVSPTIVGADSHGSAEEVTVILNSPTSLVCEAYSYPPATITWLKDGSLLESNRNIHILPGNFCLFLLINNIILLFTDCHITFLINQRMHFYEVQCLYCFYTSNPIL